MDSNKREDHTHWQCKPVEEPSRLDKVIDKIRGKTQCEWINEMKFEICTKCHAKRGLGSIAKNRDWETIGEFLCHDIWGNELWRYT
ncbi:hypothetical protein ACLX1H_002992 [Fusarium chlamydosporum]